jgi:hypothetical protein
MIPHGYMVQLVSLEMVGCGESFLANITHVISLPRMEQLVIFQVVEESERSAAHITHMILLPCMDQLVQLQTSGGGKRLAAQIAQMLPAALARVDRHVRFQLARPPKPLVTHWTVLILQLSVDQLVFAKAAGVFEHLEQK